MTSFPGSTTQNKKDPDQNLKKEVEQLTKEVQGMKFFYVTYWP